MRYKMLCSRIFLPVLVAALSLLSAADKKLPIEQTSNDLVDISATAILDKDQIRQELGSDFGGDIVVIRVTIRPVSDKPIQVSLDDFLLVSGKDGQRAQPYSPSQIAGNSTLVVTPQGTRNAGLGAANNGPIWGGIPGTGSRPQQMPGNGGGIGSTAGTTTVDSKVDVSNDDKPNPLLATLKEKVLQEKEITQPESGLLYFQMVGGKLKPKDLELHYKGPAGRLSLRFRP
jgi:hypothetical protein